MKHRKLLPLREEIDNGGPELLLFFFIGSSEKTAIGTLIFLMLRLK
jgi:hypothetical protein